LPANFDALAPRQAHGALAEILLLAIALHIAAALYHQFVRRDGLFARMGFGARR
jgi:cytochrome b561